MNAHYSLVAWFTFFPFCTRQWKNRERYRNYSGLQIYINISKTRPSKTKSLKCVHFFLLLLAMEILWNSNHPKPFLNLTHI